MSFSSPSSPLLSVSNQFRSLARAQVCARTDDILNAEELTHAAAALGRAPLNYDEYCTARDALSPKVSRHMTASLFARLPRATKDCVDPVALLSYVREAEILRAAYRRLARFEATGDRRLREHEVEHYIFAAIPSVPELAALQENFYPFYVFTTVRAFFFFLDPNRTGRVSLRALVSSRAFAEWLALLPPGHADLGPAGAPLPADALPARAPARAGNWFSAANALRVYSTYLQLDADQNGMLSRDELAAYGGGQYTRAFAERLFEECHTFAAAGGGAPAGAAAPAKAGGGGGGGAAPAGGAPGGAPEIDFKTYLDVVLASEYRGSVPSLRFFFRLLDVQHRGAFGLPEIRHFFGLVRDALVASGHEPVDTANVSDEILDMVFPAAPGRITLNDLRRCRVGATVCAILFDAQAFVAFDTREELKAQGAQGAGGPGGEDEEAALGGLAEDASFYSTSFNL
jgi:serine/threonine-protein phosphatase 2A regulatory subunit B''